MSIPNWCYAASTDRSPRFRPELFKPHFMHFSRHFADRGESGYVFALKWYRQIKGQWRQYGQLVYTETLLEGRVRAFVEKRWLEDADTYDRLVDRWEWIPFIGPRIVKKLAGKLFRIAPIK